MENSKLEKQIEEMADEIYETLMLEAECPLSGMDCAIIADLLVKRKGYRKSSDVAREIFEEIEKMLNMQAIIVCQTRQTVMKADAPALSYMAMLDGRIYSIRVVEEHIAELKKKYMGEK